MKVIVKVWYFSTPDQVPSVVVDRGGDNNNNKKDDECHDHDDDDDRPTVAVVIDVLRATTTITALLEHGAVAVETFDDVDVLKQTASSWQRNNEVPKLLVGERGGIMIDGFDLGNSPAVITSDIVQGRRIFMSTTNGTRALATVREGVPDVYCACLPNRSAVSKQIVQRLSLLGQSQQSRVVANNDTTSTNVWIIGSGGEGKFSLEDTFCAGAVVSALLEDAVQSTTAIDIELANDDMVGAMAVWECYKSNPEKCLRTASHGKTLTGIMTKEDADADFRACSALDISHVVPVQSRPGVLEVKNVP